MLTVRLP